MTDYFLSLVTLNALSIKLIFFSSEMRWGYVFEFGTTALYSLQEATTLCFKKSIVFCLSLTMVSSPLYLRPRLVMTSDCRIRVVVVNGAADNIVMLTQR